MKNKLILTLSDFSTLRWCIIEAKNYSQLAVQQLFQEIILGKRQSCCNEVNLCSNIPDENVQQRRPSRERLVASGRQVAVKDCEFGNAAVHH